ncbi:MAG: hypothetical protein LBJ75_02400 [Puniceicoccales bacterium]|jgi:hypothetical protein|nr:hypothetical protein [Puniceicoccales bacterium]
MNSVNNSGSTGFFDMLQRGIEAVEKVAPEFTKSIKEFLPEIPLVVPLMQSARPLVQALVQQSDDFSNGRIFSELSTVPVGDMFERWGPEYVDFIKTHCMKPFEECVGDNVTIIEDPDKVFVARSEFAPDISIAQAQKFGFILPTDINERVRRNTNLKIKPLMIRCFGVGSGSTLDQIREGTKNILSSSTDRLASANDLILSHIKSVQEKFKSDSNVIVAPFITGFSLGGMFASAIAARNNFSSMVFNGLGLGETGCKFVGKENWARAQQQPDSHVAMFVDHDFVASPDSPWHDSTKTPGRIVRIPSDNPERSIAKMGTIHFYKENFDKAHKAYLASRPHARDRLVA